MKVSRTLPSILCFHYGVFGQSSLQDVISQINGISGQNGSSGNPLANISNILGSGLTNEGITNLLQQLTSTLGQGLTNNQGLNNLQNQINSVLGAGGVNDVINQIQNGNLLANLTNGLGGLNLTNIPGIANNTINDLASSISQILGGNGTNSTGGGTTILNNPSPQSVNGGINLQGVGSVDPVSLLSGGTDAASKQLLSLLSGADSGKLISLLGSISNTLNPDSGIGNILNTAGNVQQAVNALGGLASGLAGNNATAGLGDLGTNLVSNLGGLGGLLTTSSTPPPTIISNTLDGIAATMITDNYLNSAGQNAIRLSGMASKAMMYPDLALALEGQMPVVDGTGKLTSSVVSGLGKLGITATTPGELLSAAMGSLGTPTRVLIEAINDDPLRASLTKFNKSLQEAIDAHEGPRRVPEKRIGDKEYNSWLGDMWGKVTGNENSAEAGSEKWKGDVKEAATDLADHLQKMADDLRKSDVAGMLEKWWENNGGKNQRRLMDHSGNYYQRMYSGCGHDCRSTQRNGRLRGYGQGSGHGYSSRAYGVQPQRFKHYRGGQAQRNQYGFMAAKDPAGGDQVEEIPFEGSRNQLKVVKAESPQTDVPQFQFRVPELDKELQQFQQPGSLLGNLIPSSGSENAFGLPSQLNNLLQPFMDTLEDFTGPLFNSGGFGGIGQVLGMKSYTPTSGGTSNLGSGVEQYLPRSDSYPRVGPGPGSEMRPDNSVGRVLQAQESSYSPELIEKLQQMLGGGSIELHSLGQPNSGAAAQLATANQGLTSHNLQGVGPESVQNAISLVAGTQQNGNNSQSGVETAMNSLGSVAVPTQGGHNLQTAGQTSMQGIANAVNLLATGTNGNIVSLDTPMNGSLPISNGVAVGGCPSVHNDSAGILNNLDLTRSIDAMSAERVAEVFKIDQLVVDNLPLIDSTNDTRASVIESFKNNKFVDAWSKVNITALPGLEQSDTATIQSQVLQGKFGSLLGKLRLHQMSGLENVTVLQVQRQIILDNLDTLLPHLGYYNAYDNVSCVPGSSLQGINTGVTDDIGHGASVFPSLNAGASLYPAGVNPQMTGGGVSVLPAVGNGNGGMQQLVGSNPARLLRDQQAEDLKRLPDAYQNEWSDAGRRSGAAVLAVGDRRISNDVNRGSNRKPSDFRSQNFDERKDSRSRKWQAADSLPDVLSYVNNDTSNMPVSEDNEVPDAGQIPGLGAGSVSDLETDSGQSPVLAGHPVEKAFNPYAGIPGLEGLPPPPHPYAGIPGLEDMKIPGINAPIPGIVYPEGVDTSFQNVGVSKIEPLSAKRVEKEEYSIADILGTLGESDYNISDLLAELNKSGMDLNQLFNDSAATGISLDRILKSLSNANVDVKKFLQDINRSNVDINRLVHQLAHSKMTLDDTLKALTVGGLDYNAMVHQLAQSGMDVNNLIRGAKRSGIDMEAIVQSNSLPGLVSSGVLSSAGISGLLGGISGAETLNPHALLTAGNQGIAMVDLLHNKVSESGNGSAVASMQFSR